MRYREFCETKTLELPTIDVGDTVLVGKFKNRKAIIRSFTTDKNNQPVLKTDKGDQKLFKPRIAKLMDHEIMTEETLPTTARELIQRYGGRAVAFGKLPKVAKLAIRTRAAEHLDPDEKAPRIDPNMPFGYVEIPMDALKHAMLASIKRDDPKAPFANFDEYHHWYTSHGDTPNHTEVWPIELDMVADNQIIDDGSHRLHSYIRRGLKIVPAIYSID
jgi:hypothetical protein